MTYQEACKAAKKEKNKSFQHSAGEGLIGEIYWCSFRNRLIKKVSREGKVWF